MTQGISSPLEIASIPPCVVLEELGGWKLRDVLTALDQKVSQERGVAADSFISAEEFNRARQAAWGGIFRRRWDFPEFLKFVDQTMRSQRCSKPCAAERGEPLEETGDGWGTLCAAPPPPELPAELPRISRKSKPRRSSPLSLSGELPESGLHVGIGHMPAFGKIKNSAPQKPA